MKMLVMIIAVMCFIVSPPLFITLAVLYLAFKPRRR